MITAAQIVKKALKEAGSDDGDTLAKFLEDLIYMGTKDRLGLGTAQDVATRKSKVFARYIETLLGDEYADDPCRGVVGGTADANSFSVELEDGRAISGGGNGAKFRNKIS